MSRQGGGSRWLHRFRMNPDLQVGAVIGVGLLLVFVKLFFLS